MRCIFLTISVIFFSSCNEGEFASRSGEDSSKQNSTAVSKANSKESDLEKTSKEVLTEEPPAIENEKIQEIEKLEDNTPINPIQFSNKAKIMENADMRVEGNDIVFGSNTAYHIGDGFYPSGSCKKDLNINKLRGLKYFFVFEVPKNDTEIEVLINTLCGVDFLGGGGHKDEAQIIDASNNVLLSLILTPGSANSTLNKIKLPRGQFALKVISHRYNGSDSSFNGDHDDFMVGNITIKPDAAGIKPVEIRFE